MKKYLSIALASLMMGSMSATDGQGLPTPKFDKAITEIKTEFHDTFVKRLQALATILVEKAVVIKSSDPNNVYIDLVLETLLKDKHSSLVGVPEELEEKISGMQGTTRAQQQLQFLEKKYQQVLGKLKVKDADKLYYYGTTSKLPDSLLK